MTHPVRPGPLPRPTVSPPVSPPVSPTVSVVIPSFQGASTIGVALESLIAQTMDHAEFEAVVVLNGPPCGTEAVLAETRRRHPSLRLRSVSLQRAGAARARNAGVVASRGEYVTFLDDDDAISPAFLATLVEASEPGVIPVAFIADVPVGGATPDPTEPPPNYVNDLLVPHAGKRVAAELAGTALSPNAAKLIPRALAAAYPYREDLRSGEDVVFWTHLFAATEPCFHVPLESAGAMYFRTVRPDSLSRQESSFDFDVSQRLDCIKALAEIPADSRLVELVVQGKKRSQAGWLRSFVLENPDRRDEVFAEIEARDIEDFPYSAVNQGQARDLAILYCFAPFQDTSALVAARRLRERDRIVDVISNNLDQIRESDKWSNRLTDHLMDEHRQLNVGQASSNWLIMEQFSKRAQVHIEVMEEKKGKYESVYSRTMWPSSQFAAALYKARNPDVRWIAEFSDPMLRDIHGEERRDLCRESPLLDELRHAMETAGQVPPARLMLWEWVEAVTYALADEIIFTNTHQREFMLDYCYSPRLAQRALAVSVVQPHPTLPESFYHQVESSYELDTDRANIAYFGVFYATRGLDEIAQGLLALTPDERSMLRLHVFTNLPEDSRSKIDSLGLGDTVVVNAYKPYLEFLNLATRFDVLLVQDARTSHHHSTNPYLPSKMSDYQGSGTAVWSVVEPGSALSSIPTTFQSDLGDHEGARRVLAEIATKFSGSSADPWETPEDGKGSGR